MTRFNVRYMVNDFDAAVAFYTTHFGFRLLSNAAPAFADVLLGDLRLLLSGPTSSAGRPMPDGRQPAPGGGNRIQLLGDDLPPQGARLPPARLPVPETIGTRPRGAPGWDARPTRDPP